jgi:class 3 adenylate cyclase
MNICPHCGFQNSDNTHICLNCATTLKIKCRKCGAEVPNGDRFCGKCGAPLEPAETPTNQAVTPAPGGMNMQERMLRDLHSKMPSAMVSKFMQGSRELYGQRREVTVLIVEIANFSQISRSADSESVYFAVDEIVHLLADMVYKYEGTIDKYSGNGLVALFGLPFNHENDPERAVRAALEMLYSIRQLHGYLNERYHQDYEIQVGINTGSVIAGVMTGQQHLEYTVIGDTVHLATHLQRVAHPGRIMVSFSTYQRTRPIFDYQSLPPVLVDGASEPAMVYEPLGLRQIPGQVRGLPGMQVPMIGRREHLDQLVQVFKHVVDTSSSEIVF